MTIYMIGSRSSENSPIFEFANENGYKVECSGTDNIEAALLEATKYPISIFDLSNVPYSVGRYGAAIASFILSYKGMLIVFAPSGIASESDTELFANNGARNIVNDFMPSKAKNRIKGYVESVSNSGSPVSTKVPNTQTKTIPRSMTIQEMYGSQPVGTAGNYNYPSVPVSNMPNENIPQAFHQSYNYPRQPVQPPFQQPMQQTMQRPYNAVQAQTRGKEPYSESNSPNAVNANSWSENKYKKTTKVGVIGIMPRIGTTTQAVLIAEFLAKAGKSVCYIQENKSTFIKNMENYFANIEKDETKGCLVYEGLDFYSNPNLVYSTSHNYEYHVIDYGHWPEGEVVPSEFFDNDIRILVCGGTAEEVSQLTSIRKNIYKDERLVYIFSFIADYERGDIYELMADRAQNARFAPYTPDCYKNTGESSELYAEILGIELEGKAQQKRRGKGLFGRRKEK